MLRAAVERLAEGFDEPAADARPQSRAARRSRACSRRSRTRLRNNYPYFHPLYAGQMLKPPHPAARLAYALAMWLNPNNHALDGGRASSRMEKEAVAADRGHVRLGGGPSSATSAAAARWPTSRPSGSPGSSVPAPRSWRRRRRTTRTAGSGRCSAFPSSPIAVRRARTHGRRAALERAARTRGGVGTVVATIGTTATGSVDPLPEILALRERLRFPPPRRRGLRRLLRPRRQPRRRRPAPPSTGSARPTRSSSIPHKHGLQPYGCGCVLFRDPTVGRFYKHDSPYTYFSSDELHLGEISLECSRAGRLGRGALGDAAPAAPRDRRRVRGGARRTAAPRRSTLHAALAADARFLPAFPPELDIVVWIPRAASASAASSRSRRIFEEAARRDLHLALAELPADFFDLANAGDRARRARR